MAQPVQVTVDRSWEEAMDSLRSLLSEEGMSVVGYREDLGLISASYGKGEMLYFHFARNASGSTEISAAPGIPYLKEKPQSVVPEREIHKLFERLE